MHEDNREEGSDEGEGPEREGVKSPSQEEACD